MTLEKRFLKGEDTEKTVNGRPHSSDTPLSPRPSLRGDQVNHRYRVTAQALGESQVETGRIGEHGNVWALRHDGASELAEFAPNTAEMGQHLDQADHGKRSGIDNDPDAGSLHPRTGASKKYSIRPAEAKSLDDNAKAYRSPEASPAEIRTRTYIQSNVGRV